MILLDDLIVDFDNIIRERHAATAGTIAPSASLTFSYFQTEKVAEPPHVRAEDLKRWHTNCETQQEPWANWYL
jgi:hypothetical protein